MCKVVCFWKGLKYIKHTLGVFMLPLATSQLRRFLEQGCAKWGFDTPNHNPNPINMWRTTPNPNHNTNLTTILPQFGGKIGGKLGLFNPNFHKLTPTTQHQPNFWTKMTRNWGYPQLGPNFLHIPGISYCLIWPRTKVEYRIHFSSHILSLKTGLPYYCSLLNIEEFTSCFRWK